MNDHRKETPEQSYAILDKLRREQEIQRAEPLIESGVEESQSPINASEPANRGGADERQR